MDKNNAVIYPDNKTYGTQVLDYVDFIKRSNITSVQSLDNLMDLQGRLSQRNN
jgi:hypothetical protein